MVVHFPFSISMDNSSERNIRHRKQWGNKAPSDLNSWTGPPDLIDLLAAYRGTGSN